MIKLISLPDSNPMSFLKIFMNKLALNQPNIEAISISSLTQKRKKLTRDLLTKYINPENGFFSLTIIQIKPYNFWNIVK